MTSSTPDQPNKKPKKPKKDRLIMYNKKSTKTVGQLSDSLYYSIVCLEAEDPYIMPYDLLSDAYKIAKMIVEAEGVTPSEKLLDNIVYYYLERRQQQAANLEDKKC